MDDAMTVQVVGLDELKRRFDNISAELHGAAMTAALEAAAMPIANAAKVAAPVKTGNLRRSIHTEHIDAMSAAVGTDVVYARRLEYGFAGADSLGRVYNQPPRPYMRPAFDSQKDAALHAAQAVLAAVIERGALS